MYTPPPPPPPVNPSFTVWKWGLRGQHYIGMFKFVMHHSFALLFYFIYLFILFYSFFFGGEGGRGEGGGGGGGVGYT